MTIFQALSQAGVPLDSHESDLYAKVTPDSRRILSQYPNVSRSVFRSNVDGQSWYDIPFRYDPFWAAKADR